MVKTVAKSVRHNLEQPQSSSIHPQFFQTQPQRQDRLKILEEDRYKLSRIFSAVREVIAITIVASEGTHTSSNGSYLE
jgi:hypothetical protein